MTRSYTIQSSDKKKIEGKGELQKNIKSNIQIKEFKRRVERENSKKEKNKTFFKEIMV